MFVVIYREYYYIQMEKFARDAIKDNRIQRMEDIIVSSSCSSRGNCDLFRIESLVYHLSKYKRLHSQSSVGIRVSHCQWCLFCSYRKEFWKSLCRASCVSRFVCDKIEILDCRLIGCLGASLPFAICQDRGRWKLSYNSYGSGIGRARESRRNVIVLLDWQAGLEFALAQPVAHSFA